MNWNKTPAIVRYKEKTCEKFTSQKLYEAYFLEYWQGERNSLHVCDNLGKITDYNLFEDFEVISDVDNLLNCYEAVVRCISHNFSDGMSGLTFGKEYKAIGRDADGMYLVMDNSMDCYFYSAAMFEIIEDSFGILNHRSIYYSFHQKSDEPVKY